jgi:hypothetical protein
LKMKLFSYLPRGQRIDNTYFFLFSFGTQW